MFYVKHTEGGCDPLLRCHVCAKTIDDIDDAVVVYPRVVEESQVSRAVVVHREDCLYKATLFLQSDHGEPHAIGLEEFLDRLLWPTTAGG